MSEPEISKLIREESSGSSYRSLSLAKATFKALVQLEESESEDPSKQESAKRAIELLTEVVRKEQEVMKMNYKLARSLQHKFNIDVSEITSLMGRATPGEKKYLKYKREKEESKLCK